MIVIPECLCRGSRFFKLDYHLDSGLNPAGMKFFRKLRWVNFSRFPSVYLLLFRHIPFNQVV